MTEPFFTKDTKGDKQNVIYGRPDQYSTPKYRAAGQGYLIGFNRDHRLSKVTSDRREVLRHGSDPPRREKHQSLLSSGEITKEERLRPTPENSPDELGGLVDYVSLRAGPSRKRRRLPRELPGNAEDTTSGEEEDSLTEDTNGEAYLKFRNDHNQKRQRGLRQEVATNPDNVEAWLALVGLQEEVVAEQNRSRPQRASERRVVSSLRMSLFEEALSKVHHSAARTRLTEGYMREGAKIWEKDKKESQWQKVLKDKPSFEIWVLYINYQQSNHDEFTIDKTLEAYKQAIRDSLHEDPSQESGGHCVYLLLRVTLFLSQTGFSERAAAVWQAILEVNFFRPPSLKPGEDMNAFEEFWDGEVARLGERGAKGWSGVPYEMETSQDPITPDLDKVHLLSSWASAEQAMSEQLALPARAIDRTDEADIYRVVLFSDIEDLIFLLKPEHTRPLLLDAFLWFTGRPVLARAASSTQWASDPHLCVSKSCPELKVPFSGTLDTLTLFEQGRQSLMAFERPMAGSVFSSWTRRTVQQIALSRPHDARLGEYCIALESVYDSASARKLSKRLLKQAPGSIRLYNAYALLGPSPDDFAAAETVWKATILSQNSNARDLVPETMLLWHTWIWACLHRKDVVRAHALFYHISRRELPSVENSKIEGWTQGEQFTGLYEDIKRDIELGLDKARSSGDLEAVALAFDLLALFEYFHNSQDLLQALQSYESSLPLLAIVSPDGAKSDAVERLHQHRARLIDFHAKIVSKPFKPKIVLEALEDSVTAFPNNSIFSLLYRSYRQKYGLVDRLRQGPTPDRIPQNLIQSILNIDAEMSLPGYAGSTEHSVRAAFLRTEEDHLPTRTCPAIRLAHVRWEIEIGLLEKNKTTLNVGQHKKARNTDRPYARALEAFYSAMDACPWVKELYLMAFSSDHMRDALGPTALRVLYERMLARGLRVHIDISDLLKDQAQ